MEDFRFRIHGVEQIKSVNGLDNVIVSVAWTYYLFLNTEERRAMRSLSGTLSLDIPETSEGFVPVENINANTIIGWVENALDVPAMQERLRFLIAQEMVPTFTSIIEGLNVLNNPQ